LRPDLTSLGVVVGTPSYMAPEQARAEKGLSTAVDIYGLGAILYEILTGRPPFPTGPAVAKSEVVLEVGSDKQPVRPSTLRPGVPADLEAICLKCLSKEPGKRYASAEALADDLGRFRSGEPVAARPVGAVRGAVMWARRRPLLAGMLAALVLTTGGSVAGAVWALKALKSEREARAIEEGTHRDFGKLAIETFEGDKLKHRSAWMPGTEPLRLKLHEKLLALYLRRLQRYPDDVEMQKMTGRAYLLVGASQQQLGMKKEAEESFTQAIHIWENLVGVSPDNALSRRNLARSLDGRGQLLYKGRPEEVERARADFRRAQREMEHLVKVSNEPADRLDLATYHLHEGMLLHHQGLRLLAASSAGARQANRTLDEAEKALRLARKGLMPEPEWAPVVGSAFGRAGGLPIPWQAGWAVETAARARKAYGEAPAEQRYQLALACTSLGSLLKDRQQPNNRVERHYRLALDLYRPLVADDPRVPEYREQLAHCLYRLGNLLGETGQGLRALDAWREAVQHQARLAQDFPRVPRYCADLARTHILLGHLLANMRRPEEAGENYDRAIHIYTALIPDAPPEAGISSSLATALTLRAELWKAQGNRESLEKSRQLLERALGYAREAWRQNRWQPNHRKVLLRIYWNLAGILPRLGDPSRGERMRKEWERLSR
jgi:tetratricopeptide (TPR) repeat protein